MDFAVGGIAVAALIFGVVEAAKSFGVEGDGSRVLALALGFLFVGLAYAMEREMIPATVVPYVELVVTAVAGALAANGWYDFGKERIS